MRVDEFELEVCTKRTIHGLKYYAKPKGAEGTHGDKPFQWHSIKCGTENDAKHMFIVVHCEQIARHLHVSEHTNKE